MLTARIVYLDQCAISSIAKAKDEFWVRLHETLRLLLNRGIILCPTSQLHDEESMLSEEWRHELWAKCQELAGPWRFVPLEAIESLPLRKALRGHLGEVEGSENPQVVVNRGAGVPNQPLVSDARRSREKSFQRIHRLVEDFYSFESARAAAVQRHMEEMIVGQGANGSACLMEELAAEVRRFHPIEQNPMTVLQEFLKTQAVQPVPFLDIWSRLWATVAQHIHSTVKPRKLKPSDIYDVQAIAYYGPYCDAMFVDNEFRKLASQRNVDVPGRYGVRLFSETNREEFRTYLEEIG